MLRQTSIPLQRAVTLAAVKSHLRVDHELEDDLIATYLDAAIEDAAIYTNRILNQGEWAATFSEWPGCSSFYLPIAPIVSVDALKYFDEAGDEQELDGDLWSFAPTSDGGIVTLASAFTWPTLREEPAEQISIELTVGYDADDGSSGTDPELLLPPVIKAAIFLTVGHLHANREDVIVGRTSSVLPKAAEHLMHRKRIYR